MRSSCSITGLNWWLSVDCMYCISSSNVSNNKTHQKQLCLAVFLFLCTHIRVVSSVRTEVKCSVVYFVGLVKQVQHTIETDKIKQKNKTHKKLLVRPVSCSVHFIALCIIIMCDSLGLHRQFFPRTLIANESHLTIFERKWMVYSGAKIIKICVSFYFYSFGQNKKTKAFRWKPQKGRFLHFYSHNNDKRTQKTD